MKKMNFKRGFTLIELLVVVAIIGILVSFVLALLNNARNKGADAGVKSNLKNATVQGEVFYNTNKTYPNSYTNFCSTTSPQGGAATIYILMKAAAKVSGYASYGINIAGTSGTATCHDNALGWAAEVPLKSAGANQMWCVDWTGKSLKTTAGNFPVGDISCN